MQTFTTPRRIPRGNPIQKNRPLLQQVQREIGRIRGMKLRVKRNNDRRELEQLRRRLVEIKDDISSENASRETRLLEEIEGIAGKARNLYSSAPKLDGRRRKSRLLPKDEVAGGDENVTSLEELGAPSAPQRLEALAITLRQTPDPPADEFAAELNSMFGGRSE